MFMFRGIAVNK